MATPTTNKTQSSFPADLPAQPLAKRNMIVNFFSTLVTRLTQKSAAELKRDEEEARRQYTRAEEWAHAGGQCLEENFEEWWTRRKHRLKTMGRGRKRRTKVDRERT
jgi:hypothetical protein